MLLFIKHNKLENISHKEHTFGEGQLNIKGCSESTKFQVSD